MKTLVPFRAWNVITKALVLPEREPLEGEIARHPSGVIKEYHVSQVLTPPAIRELPAYSFWRRFTRTQRKLLRKSQVEDVQDVTEAIKMAIVVRLDHPYFIADMDILEANSIITIAERVILTRDVTLEEQ